MSPRRSARDAAAGQLDGQSAAPNVSGDDGCLLAVEHVAQWVRFADVKATILFAALSAVLTMLVVNVESVFLALQAGGWQALVVGCLGVVVVLTLLYTLWHLLSAINPRSTTTSPGINRFAWPTLSRASAAALADRGKTVDVREDAWGQVADLAEIAGKKFRAARKAVWGLGALLLVASLLVVCSVGALTNLDCNDERCPSGVPASGQPSE